MKRALASLLVVAALAAPCSAQADLATLVQGNNQFALDLFGQLCAKEGNLFLSPYSISTALGMTYAGARGDTASQMKATLHHGLEQEKLHAAFGSLLQSLNEPARRKDRPYQLSVANALWLQNDFHFLPGFLDLTKKNYNAGLNEVDFKGNTEGVRKTINDWVEKQTQDKIKDLLPPGVLNGDTRLVLTNAIHFKGNWAVQFKKEATRDVPFHLAAGQKVPVPTMHLTKPFKYLDAGAFQALELPYVGKELSMVVLLPKTADGLAEFEKTLTDKNLEGWLAKMRQTEVQVALPRFKMTSEFQLKAALEALGMRDAFAPGKADLSGMSGSPNLFIQAVVHKAFVDVNEGGAEAAAATGVVVGTTSERITPVFQADRPFMFLIRDNRTGSILFLGRVANPKA